MPADRSAILARSDFQGTGEDVAALGKLFHLARDDAIDIAAGFGQLVEVGFQRAPQDVAALGELFDLAGDQSVDAAAALGQLVEIVLRARA